MDLKLLLLQIAVIFVITRLVGWVFRKCRQPQVVGEMIAGILLGPSFLGWLSPSFHDYLFRAANLGPLNALSQIGVLLFMFMVGVELDVEQIREMRLGTVQISIASILLPFVGGIALARWLYASLSSASVPFSSFALFLGTAMSVTAFPVLARILKERNLAGTRMGTMAISCAAVDDVTAWCLLAVVIAVVRGQGIRVPFWALLYVSLMWFGIRPLFRRFAVSYQRNGAITSEMLALLLLFTIISSWTTEALGIHALFGAFAAGVLMPKMPAFVNELRQKLEPVSTVLLLPLFFAFIGLRTRIGLVSGFSMWLYCLALILVATAGKFGGATLSARATGLEWGEACALGILMNTRGLVELVILNVGMDLGVLSPTLFSMMVVMALGTTFMTTPLLQWIERFTLSNRMSAASPR